MIWIVDGETERENIRIRIDSGIDEEWGNRKSEWIEEWIMIWIDKNR